MSPEPPIPALLDLLGGRFPGHTMQRVRLPDGRYRYSFVSPGVRQTFGLDAEALMAADSVGHEWLPEPDRARFVAALERSAATLETLDEEVRVQRPGRPLRWVRSIGHPRRLPDGTVVWDGVALDVTDRHEARAALEAALEAARRREMSGSGLASVALHDLALPLALLRQEIEALPDAGHAAQRLTELEAAIASAVTLLRAAEAADASDAAPAPALPAAPVSAVSPPFASGDTSLTTRQRDIHALLRAGKSNRDIARALGIGEGTVKLHVSGLLRRLGVRNRTEAALHPG